ncbi:hypothetical protein P3X46_035277 [Hevea brasiliensis]|uniref:Uncharacterized protein n=1 Tax=Hevea brasiliensis TaxID=3981 RepID=A0ABQ9KAG5_HEVBR|nr:uncharacterized protein LOC110666545 [Hevea brasiliensis]KAJ9131191.1 hypothetical protein P3X46_035277 [Hevea brasiliensis]
MEESKPSSPPSSPSSPSSLKHKLKLKHPFSLLSPFRKINHNHESLPPSPDADKSSKLLRTSSSTSTWIKSRAHDILRIGRHAHPNNGHAHGRGRRRRHSLSADFHYDAMSYALNFDEGHDESPENYFPLRSFSSRLPQSPKREIECT